ncbi:MAG: motility associated factor glycosyltransferase family protein [Lachnospiraceae bacterium]|nr:motility associated factor glycosyltransferase family protein [Lachnospiraceae bacterium]
MKKSIYEKNIEALKKHSMRTVNYIEDKKKQFETDREAGPVLDDKETFAEKGMFEDIEIEVEPSYEGTPIFRVKKDGVRVYLNGRRDPNAIPRLWADKFDQLPRTTPILMFGIGNGSFLTEVDKKARDDVKIYIHEPSLKIFLKCIEEIDLSHIFENREIVISLDDNTSYEEIASIVSGCINIANLEFTKRYILPGYISLYPGEVKKYLEIIRKPMDREITNQATTASFSNIISGSLLYNAMYLPDCNTTYQLANVIPRDIPAIIVAAGPSLDKNIKDLKRAKGKAFIIAADTAMRPLLKEGIVPDMFAVVDPAKPLELVEVPGAENIPLVTSVYSSQKILAFHTGKKFFFDEGVTFINKLFEERNIDFKNLTCGGSVATLAFSLAYVLGIDRIILIGQDLALSGNKDHASGTAPGEESFRDLSEEEAKKKKDFWTQHGFVDGEIDTTGFIMVPGNVEEMVPTKSNLKMYLNWYEDQIKGCKGYRPDLKVINATEGGARIEGTDVMTLNEAIDEYCGREVDIKSLIDNIPPAFVKEGREKVVDRLHNIEPEFRKIADNALKQIAVYKKIDNIAKSKGIPMNEYRKLLVKLEKLSKEMLKIPMYQLVDDSLVDARLILQKELLLEEDSILEEAKEISRKGLIYMKLVNECALLLADVAKASISNVK